MRDPRDVAISSYYYIKNTCKLPPYKKLPDLQEFVQLNLRVLAAFTEFRYFLYTTRPELRPGMIIFYEDLASDSPFGGFEKLAKFLNVGSHLSSRYY